jgi:hypothetical protein
MLLCDRPHERSIDFETSRFIVSKATGLDVNGIHLEMGDEVPEGGLSPRALRQVYEPPLSLIESLDYVKSMDDPYLREACARRGIVLEDSQQPPTEPATEPITVEAPKPKFKAAQLDKLTRNGLVALCAKNGLPTDGNKSDLRSRLETLLG